MNVTPLLAALAVVTSAVAGCTSTPEDGTVGEGSHPGLGPDRGAIVGLVVDDRFRPLHLAERAEGEHSDQGFILVRQTGEQVESDEDGGFVISDLVPGTYTLLVQAGQHEATPQQVQVHAGVFAETTIVARRLIDRGGVILTNEFVAFIPCSVQLVQVDPGSDCTLDQSGDTDRSAFTADYTSLGDVSYLITEMRANQVGDYGVYIGFGSISEGDAGLYAYEAVYGGDYLKIVMAFNMTYESPYLMESWDNDWPIDTSVSVYGEGAEATGTLGVGAELGIKARFLVSAVIGEPDVDVATYCLLCP